MTPLSVPGLVSRRVRRMRLVGGVLMGLGWLTAVCFAQPATGSPWADTNVGDVGGGGSTTVAGDSVTINGAGADIWDRADEFRFRYQSWSGDGELIARVTRLDPTHGWAKAGVMIRESLAANSRHAFLCVSSANGVALQSRGTTGGESANLPVSADSTLPRWLRIVRVDSNISSFVSQDGVSWTEVGGMSANFWPTTIYFGLAVTSHDDTQTTRADFDHVLLRAPQSTTAAPTIPSGVTAVALSPTEVRVTWTDNSNNETSFEIYRAYEIESGRLIATVGANVTTFTDTGLQPGAFYEYRVRAKNSAGVSNYSSDAEITMPTQPSGSWSGADVGAVGIAGTQTYDGSGGVPTVTGSGADIWGERDEFRFVYQRRTGDVAILVRVNSVEGTDPWAKAGIMFRESLADNARYAMAFVNPQGDAGMQTRRTLPGTSHYMAPVTGQPMWLKLVRTGSLYDAYQSSDGQTWQWFSSSTVDLGASPYVGLAVTSHNDGVLCTAEFDNVSVSTASSSPDTAPAAPTSLIATGVNSQQINLSWTDNASDESGYAVERSTDDATFALIADLPAGATTYSATSLVSDTIYYFRVRAKKGNLFSAYSNTVRSATPAAPGATWTSVDVGNVGLAGSTETAGNTITVRGSGADIWGRRDAFRYVSRQVTGDGVVEARVISLTNTHGWAKAGVMIRDGQGIGDGNRNVFVLVSPAHGVVAQARTDGSGAGETSSTALPAANAPYWVRITRAGNLFTAAASPDGATWTTIATYTIPMGATASYGFAVTSHDDTQLCTAVFADPSVR